MGNSSIALGIMTHNRAQNHRGVIRGDSNERRVDDTFYASGDRRVHGRYVLLYPIGRLVYGDHKERVNASEGPTHRGPIRRGRQRARSGTDRS